MSTFKGFSSVELRRPRRSLFDLSHEKRLSTRMGRLTPVFISEVLPNDTFKVNTEVMLRLAPLLAPIMHRVNVFVHFFFVPNRLLWSQWELFITGGRLGTETPPVPPFAQLSDIGARGQSLLNTGSLADYMGWPNIADAALAAYGARSTDLMPFAAYYKVWEDYYRDRNFVADTTILPLGSGIQGATQIDALMAIRRRAWEADYFTTALPWVQRGNAVLIPVSGNGAVTYAPISNVFTSGGVASTASTSVGTTATAGQFGVNGGGTPGRIENIASVSFTNSTVTMNDLRRAARLQEWLERNALGGSRYVESIYNHFARRTSDARLQRAEYLGGGKVPVNISEVVTTAFSVDGAAQNIPAGNMAGHGLSFGNTNRIRFNSEEHGFVIGIMSVMPSSGYMQGIPRMFRRRNTFLEYPWPTFANLGEQEVYTNELFVDGTTMNATRSADPVFGYQSRYSDWKYIPSSAHGAFRSSLQFWHLTRSFASAPVLGEAFVTFEDALQNRVFAVSNVDTLWCYVYNNCKVVRSLPYFGTPELSQTH